MFAFVQFGTPDIKDQYQPVSVAIVPRLMLDSVIKNDDLALLPLNCAITDPEATIRRHHQWQMANVAAIDHALMRWDARTRAKQRQHH